MSGSIMRLLILTDVYRYRWMIGGSLIAGAASIAIASRGGLAYGIGSIAFITNLVALGIFIAMYSIVQERKDRASLFVLSLPVSTRQYAAAKIISATITYCLPWALLTAAVLGTIAATAIPNGVIPSNVALLLYFLTIFIVFLAVAMSVQEEKWIVTAIVATNMSISLFISSLRLIPSIAEHLQGPVAVWSPAIIAIIAAELALIALAVGLMVLVQLRRRDFV